MLYSFCTIIQMDSQTPILIRGFICWETDRSQTPVRYIRLSALLHSRQLHNYAKIADDSDLRDNPGRSSRIKSRA